MSACKYCNDLNDEKEDILVEDIKLSVAGHYHYEIPILHCPYCGEKLEKYKDGNRKSRFDYGNEIDEGE